MVWHATTTLTRCPCLLLRDAFPPPLQVLGRSEFKQLLRWRLLVKKDLQRAAAAAAKAAAAEGGEGGEGEEGEEKEEEDPEEKLLREMGEIKER